MAILLTYDPRIERRIHLLVAQGNQTSKPTLHGTSTKMCFWTLHARGRSRPVFPDQRGSAF